MISYINYLKTILYLFSAYSVFSIAIVYWKSDRKLFFIHLSITLILILNFFGVVFVRILGYEIAETILFHYAMPVILILLDLSIWAKVYSTSKNKNSISSICSNDRLRKIVNEDLSGDKSLLEISKMTI